MAHSFPPLFRNYRPVPRTFADYVVSEYGIAHIRFKTRRRRAEALINIAHPDRRGEVRDSLKKKFYPGK
jgi:4-hydroxybutyrate CoA-transferase